MIKLSIIIPTKDRQQMVKDLVQSITLSKFINLKCIELIIVNDGLPFLNNSDLLKFKKDFNRIKIIENKFNRGASYSRNRGVHFAKSKYLLFIDDDNEVGETFISKLYQYIKKHKNCVMVGGFSYFWNSKDINYGAWYVNLSQNAIRKGTVTYERIQKEKIVKNVSYIPNAFLVRKRQFIKIGGFDINFLGSYFEDTDFGLRINKFGNISVIPDAIIYHKATLSTFNDIKKLSNFSYNYYYFCKKYTNSKLNAYLGLFRLKVGFIYELLKRRKIFLALQYLIITPIEFIKIKQIW